MRYALSKVGCRSEEKKPTQYRDAIQCKDILAKEKKLLSFVPEKPVANY